MPEEQRLQTASTPPAASKNLTLALIPLGIALNLALGTFIHAIRAPIYLDEVGTACVVMLVGLRAGIAVGVISFLLGGLLTNPVLPYFVGTQIAVAVYVYLVGKRGGYRSWWRAVLAGIGLGVVAGIVSAPVIVYLFGGVTGSGSSFLTAFLLASGKSMLQSVFLSGLAAEPLDKTLQTLLMVYLLRGLPKNLLKNFPNSLLPQNGIGV
jgi:energy-coupling factor transport system substrate-specific component